MTSKRSNSNYEACRPYYSPLRA